MSKTVQGWAAQPPTFLKGEGGDQKGSTGCNETSCCKVSRDGRLGWEKIFGQPMQSTRQPKSRGASRTFGICFIILYYFLILFNTAWSIRAIFYRPIRQIYQVRMGHNILKQAESIALYEWSVCERHPNGFDQILNSEPHTIVTTSNTCTRFDLFARWLSAFKLFDRWYFCRGGCGEAASWKVVTGNDHEMTGHCATQKKLGGESSGIQQRGRL